MIKKLYISYLILTVFICFSSHAIAEEIPEEQPSSAIQFLKNIFKKIDFASRLTTTYDSNIFLTEDDESSDLINSFTQSISLKIPEDNYYLEIGYTGNISYYSEEGAKTYDHTANFLYSYRPFENFSFGVGNYFNMIHTKKITTTVGDRLLSRGYKEDTPVIEIKYEPIEKVILDLAATYYYLDASSASDDYIDRGDIIGDFALNYEIWPDLTTVIGYGYQDNHFPHLTTKDAKSHRGFVAFEKKFESFNLTAEVGQQYKETNFQKKDVNTDFRIDLGTTYSVFTRCNLALTFHEVNPSARSEYFQYFNNAIEISFWHLLNPKTSVSTSVSYERQKFDSSDVLSGNSPEDRATDIISFNTALNRNLNDSLSLNLAYGITKRNTDFVQEGYTDNRISFGLTASY